MVSKVKWDELNLAVAGSSFIISLGTMYLPAELTAGLPLAIQSVVTQPMLVGVVMLIVLNTVVNVWIRPALERRASGAVHRTPFLQRPPDAAYSFRLIRRVFLYELEKQSKMGD